MANRQLWIRLWLITVVIWTCECALLRRVETTTRPTVNVTKKERPMSLGTARMHILRRTIVDSITEPVTRKLNIFEIPFVKGTSKIVSVATVSTTARVTTKRSTVTKSPIAMRRLNFRIRPGPQTIKMRTKDKAAGLQLRVGNVDRQLHTNVDRQPFTTVARQLHTNWDRQPFTTVDRQLHTNVDRQPLTTVDRQLHTNWDRQSDEQSSTQLVQQLQTDVERQLRPTPPAPPGGRGTPPGGRGTPPGGRGTPPGGQGRPGGRGRRPWLRPGVTRAPNLMWPEYTLGAFQEMGPKRHPVLVKRPPRNDSIRRHWPTTWPCPIYLPFLNECTRPRDLDFYPKTKYIDEECTGSFTVPLPHERNGSEFEELLGRYVDLKPLKPHIECTSPTSTFGPTTFKCPSTTHPLPNDPLCLYSCTYPKTTGCCTDPTSTCSEPTSTEKPIECCTDPTNTPYVPPLYRITCYELTEKMTTPKPCICFKVLEFTMTRDKCLPTCTQPTSTCPPPATTSLPSTCTTSTPCIKPTVLASTHRTQLPDIIPCHCLTVGPTTCRKSADSLITTTPCVVLVPTTCTIICSEQQPPCVRASTLTTTCKKQYVRDADNEDETVVADYAHRADVNNSRRDVAIQPCSRTTAAPAFNWWAASSTNSLNNLYIYLAWPDSLNKTRFAVEVNTCSLASKLSVGFSFYIGLKVIVIGLLVLLIK